MSSPADSMPSFHMAAPAPRPAPSGLFVTFEGGDGAGKSTQITLTEQWLNSSDSPLADPHVTVTREPGGTPLGTQIRELILHSEHVDDRAEALLYAADRAHHVATKIRPSLESGGVVISDRYFDSSLAYQGAGRTLNPNDVHALSLWATSGLEPHLTFLLDIDPDCLAQRRDASTHDRLERAGHEFHARVRSAFLDLARHDPERWVIIDATQSIEQVHAEVTKRMTDWMRAHDHMLLPPPQHPVEKTSDPETLL